ncbi:ABC transporter substrate-binding protein [Nocardioides kongjuensis]|uniref:Polar amino acid transport system substrate-binding protein n=1 Tax=Nocardioides kongjuensis TaxID=349522 RepID=A0A852RE09_9ACTN|nr:ABC transporter substrate-binding protein [Nocardioides kongjuensis]NYD33253.1 polar amino acid transport system substrate-binding protein [Nocardioides kongjuensis]
MSPRIRTTLAALTLAALAATGAGCSNTETTESTAKAAEKAGIGTGGREKAEAVETDPDVQALVPASIVDAGVLTVVTDPTYAPMEFTDDKGDIIGLDPDIAVAVAHKMGVEAKFEKGDFNGIIAGIEAGRYDASWASFSVTPERQQKVDMVSYVNSGTSVLVPHGNPDEIAAITDLCGKTVAAQTGNTQVLTTLPAFQKDCADAGLAKITELVLPQQDNVNQAVSTGRADALLADGALTAYYAQLQPDAFSQVDDIFVEPALLGAITKKDTGLAAAIEAAVNSLIEDGTYADLLEAWGLSAAEIDASGVNQG